MSFLTLGGESVVKVNGQLLKVEGMTIAEYLESTTYDMKRIAIERNDEIVPKSCYAQMVLEEGDVIEIVSFVGGG